MADFEQVKALLDEGLTHYGLGEVSKALEIWQRVLELDPSNVRAVEYVRFVKDNWAPQSSKNDDSYRPDEGTDPTRAQEGNNDAGFTEVGSASSSQEYELKPEEVPVPDESGFVSPVKPIANLWGDLYDFDGSASSQEPTVPAGNFPAPSIGVTDAALFVGDEEPTLEADGLAAQDQIMPKDVSSEPAICDEHAVMELIEDQDEHSPEESVALVQEPESVVKNDVEKIMSSTLPPRPVEAKENTEIDSLKGGLDPFRSPPPELGVEPGGQSPNENELSQSLVGNLRAKDSQTGPDIVEINPVPPFAEVSTDGGDDFEQASAISLVAASEEESVTEVEPISARDDSNESMLKGALDLLEIDDFSGALEVLGKILAQDPGEQEALRMRQEAEESLMAILSAKLGDMQQSPEVCMPNDEIIWLNLDNRAGFVLSLVDGNTSFEDVLSLCGLSRLDGMRILVQLVQDKVIHVT